MIDIKEAEKSGFYISGSTGYGKTDLAMNIADQLTKNGNTVIVFDNTMDWMQRSSIGNVYTAQSPEIPFVAIIQQNTIIDLSLLNPFEQRELVIKFCEQLWNHQVKLKQHGAQLKKYFLIFEEGHIYLPQGSMRSKANAPVVQVVTGGRNFGIRFGVITQFASMIDKDAMKYMKQRFFGYTDEPNDISYVTKFMSNKKKERDAYAEQLRNLQHGEFIFKNGLKTEKVYSPIYEYGNKTKFMIETFDADTDEQEDVTVKNEEKINLPQAMISMLMMGAIVVFVFTMMMFFLRIM